MLYVNGIGPFSCLGSLAVSVGLIWSILPCARAIKSQIRPYGSSFYLHVFKRVRSAFKKCFIGKFSAFSNY